jgi:hypothetical protein
MRTKIYLLWQRTKIMRIHHFSEHSMFPWNFAPEQFLIISPFTSDSSSWESLESQIRFEDSTICRRQCNEMLRQYLDKHERKLLRVPSNSIPKVWYGSP